MQKTAILIDSTTVFEENFKKENNIYSVPLSINFDNVTFKEQGDLNEISFEIFERIKRDKIMPKTSQPSVQDFLDIYNQIIEDGFTRIIAFHLSSKLSGTVQGSQNAANIILETNPNIQINVFDTLSASQAAVIGLLEIIKLLKNNPELSNEKITEILDYYSQNSTTLLAVDTLDYLSLGGRIKPSVAALGNLFGIKPLLELKNGELDEFEKVRSQKNAYKRMLEVFTNDVKENPGKYIISGAHVLEEKNTRKIVDNMKKELGDLAEVYPIAPLSPVIGNHTGPGSVGIVWVKKYLDNDNDINS